MPLVIPQLWHNPKVTILQDDLLANTTYPKHFDVIRAANVLNLDYFDNEEISRIMITLRSRMKAGGLAVVCRTDKHERNNATVFSLDADGRFQPAARLHSGSEVEDLILALPPGGSSANQP